MKKKYVKPEIKDLGPVSKLTLGMGGSGADGGSGMGMAGLFD